MTSITPAQCLACSRLDRSTTDADGTVIPKRCTAYPDGIPTEIAMFGADHREPRGDEQDRLVFAAGDDSAGLFAAWQRFAGATAGLVEARYNPDQPRDPGGEDGGQWVSGPAGKAAGALKDTLKLAGKIDLEPDENLVASAKIDGDGGIRMALTERAGYRTLRLGLGGEGYGKPNREEGIPAWDGNPPREPLSKAEHDRLDAEYDALDAEYESASPARQAEIDARQTNIREQLWAGGQGFNGTAKFDEYGMRRLADKIGPALAEAVDEAKREAKAWDEIEALEREGNPDPVRMAELRRIARADETDTLTFDEGIVPGSDWGDVHFAVELDELDPHVRLGVWPKGAPGDWGDGRDWAGQFDVGETRKFLRLLDQYAG